MLLVSVVVLVGVALLLGAGEPVHEVVCRLVGDVAQEPVHQVLVPLKLILNGLAGSLLKRKRRIKTAFKMKKVSTGKFIL